MDFTSKIITERTNVAQRQSVKEQGLAVVGCLVFWSYIILKDLL